MGYYSTNNVTAEAKIDLDVAEIGKLFDGETDGNWTLAEGIYEFGKNGVKENGDTLSIESMSLALNALNGKEIPKLLKKYVDYFGTTSYGSDIVSAGFSGGKTLMERGNIDLTSFESGAKTVTYGFKGREEVSKKGIQYLITPMYMHLKLTEAANLVKKNDDVANDAAQLLWDTAVAYFTGSEFNVLFYALAGKRCRGFGTCLVAEPVSDPENEKDYDGCAPTNVEIFKHLKYGQKYIKKGKKKNVDKAIDRIIDAMLPPLMQGTLRYSYKIGKGLYEPEGVNIPNQVGQKERAEGFMFVVGALPFVHECSPKLAKKLYKHMKVPQEIFANKTVANLDDNVKKIFAYVSSCTGVTCDDLGNQLDPKPKSDADKLKVVSECLYPLAPKRCGDNPLKKVKLGGKKSNCGRLNMKGTNSMKEFCKTKDVKKGCKDTCKKRCKCNDDKITCKDIIKKKTLKEVVDFCSENPSLQSDCPSACQGWCNKNMEGGF